MGKALALKYRPTSFEDLTEQGAIVKILEHQISTNTIKHGYLFCGGAGTGKTTSARIFANMINKGSGEPIELDAASNNSVEDIRRITEQSQTKSIDSEYKVFVIDECHMLSNSAWNAFLKTLEEPPAKSIFILCTTNPEKIPATILSRVQRYNFQRISMIGVINRLLYIISKENEEICQGGTQDAVHDPEWAKEEGLPIIDWDPHAIELIAKIADGGMRDAITLVDKCLSYSHNLSVDTVVNALGVVDYSQMFNLTYHITDKDIPSIIDEISNVYNSGMDLKLFVKTYFEFILDVTTYLVTGSLEQTKIPKTWMEELQGFGDAERSTCFRLLKVLVDLSSMIKWEQNPKAYIIAKLIIFAQEDNNE